MRISLPVALAAVLTACGADQPNTQGPGEGADAGAPKVVGQSEFTSAPLSGGASKTLAADNAAPSASAGGSTNSGASAAPRTVEETDIYRLDASANRLYYLNQYRGLMVFDVTNVDSPVYLGRSPIYGTPVEMIVRAGIATVVVADWYGTTGDGAPFHGSIVRGIDATNPASMKILGEAQLGGWVRDTRVVGDVLYAVSEQYGWEYGWGGYYYGGDMMGGVAVSSTGASAVVSSVSFAGGVIQKKGSFSPPGYNSVFNVTPNAILFVHGVANADGTYNYDQNRTALDYIDISDPAGTIKPRGHFEFAGYLSWGGADNGRWNVDFADGKTAHVLACGASYCGGNQGNLILATVDFTDPDAPAAQSMLSIGSSGWSPTARFDAARMYLSPNDYSGCYSGSGVACSTPVSIYDLTNPKAPAFAGSVTIAGQVWLFMPSGNRLFALGDDYDPVNGGYGSNVSLRYLDVTSAAAPAVLGTSTFGEGWAWTPAAGTFKAFIKDDTQGLVVLPFSGWSSVKETYNNGVQLIQFTPQTIATAGAAKTKGWVERGIFVKDAAGTSRIVSLSDQALAVVDYTDRMNPVVKKEITLARNVVDARPIGDKVAALSTDWWWGNDQKNAELRVLPAASADEVKSIDAVASIAIDGTNARVFHNGTFSYVVTNLRREIPCPAGTYNGPRDPGDGKTTPTCYQWYQHVQVVDLSTGVATRRGAVDLPAFSDSWYGDWGWGGCYYSDWYWGDGIVQVGGDALAFNRYQYNYSPTGEYAGNVRSIFVVDVKNPDQPTIGSTPIITGDKDWWGDLRAVGDKLYTTHYEWLPYDANYVGQQYVRYYLDIVDLSDRKNPTVSQKINVPGVFVGTSETDPTIIYTIDYRYWGERTTNDFAVLRLDGRRAYLQSVVEIPGYVGNTFVRGAKAYASAQTWDDKWTTSKMQLWQIDLTDPQHPVATQTAATQGWGWLVGVEGDRAFVTSGWSGQGVDIFRLGAGAPVFDQTVRTLGWGLNSLSRQDNTVFIASGYWGVQKIALAQ
jgi:hypothetical protein